MVSERGSRASVADTNEEILVSAWVPTSEASERVRARVVAWTDHTVEVEWPLDDRAPHRVWIWKGAISAP